MRNEILKALKASSEGNIEKARLNICLIYTSDAADE